METGVYDEIVRQLRNLPPEKVLEAKEFIDYLALLNERQSQSDAARFSDLSAFPTHVDDAMGALLETIDEGYPGVAAKAAQS